MSAKLAESQYVLYHGAGNLELLADCQLGPIAGVYYLSLWLHHTHLWYCDYVACAVHAYLR